MTSSIFCPTLKAEKIEAWLTELTRSFPPLSGPILSSSAARVWVKEDRIWKIQREELGREVCVWGVTLLDLVGCLTILHFTPTEMRSQ